MSSEQPPENGRASPFEDIVTRLKRALCQLRVEIAEHHQLRQELPNNEGNNDGKTDN